MPYSSSWSGLNDSLSHIRRQILLIDPLPAINKVFFLVLQEERQRDIFIVSPSQETIAMLTRTNKPQQNRFGKPKTFLIIFARKDLSVHVHCGLPGHLVDKCYKLHEYPLGYKSNRPKVQFSYANQVQEFQSDYETHLANPPSLTITQEQC